jgi:PhoPQ-activated pathogenicity-related protein
MSRWITLVAAALTSANCTGPDNLPSTALVDYVTRPDSSFEWRIQRQQQIRDAEITQLILHSQTWRDVVWKHQLIVIRPDAVDPDELKGLLVIGGGRWRDSYETEPMEILPDDTAVFIEMANRLQTVVTVIGQVPFQPLFDLREDDLIAYTFEKYLDSGDPDWPLLLPMVKSAVAAMDTTTAFAAQEWGASLDSFTVIGGSKRGWTTWLTGAVDPRAETLVPVVIDALNFAEHMPYQTEIWGAPSYELAPYAERNLIDILAAEQGDDLRTIVDPYSYREQLTQPKLVVAATNDTFFPLDAMNLYWNDLPAPKYALYLPNEGHSIEDYARLIPTLKAIHERGATLPQLEWEFENDGAGLRLCVSGSPNPVDVVLWTAESADTDFRDSIFVPETVAPASTVFVGDAAAPSTGFKAVFAEVFFGATNDERFSVSTNVRVIASDGRPASALTALDGTQGVCP